MRRRISFCSDAATKAVRTEVTGAAHSMSNSAKPDYFITVANALPGTPRNYYLQSSFLQDAQVDRASERCCVRLSSKME